MNEYQSILKGENFSEWIPYQKLRPISTNLKWKENASFCELNAPLFMKNIKNYGKEGKWRKTSWDPHLTLKSSLLPHKSNLYKKHLRWRLRRKIEEQSYYSGIVRETLLLHTLGYQRLEGKRREPRAKEEESSHDEVVNCTFLWLNMN